MQQRGKLGCGVCGDRDRFGQSRGGRGGCGGRDRLVRVGKIGISLEEEWDELGRGGYGGRD